MQVELPPEIQKRIPERDRWALDPDSRKAAIEAEAARRLRLSRYLMRPENGAARMEFQTRCRDPKFFFKNCLWTKDPERRLGCGLELPLIPYSYMLDFVPLKDGVMGGGWIEMWDAYTTARLRGEHLEEVRLLHEKGRRLLMSIAVMGFGVHGIRFRDGFKMWVSSAKEDLIDKTGEDWDALLGKFRFMWRKCHEFYPWLFPALDKEGTTKNKLLRIEFPEWKIEGKDVAPGAVGNNVIGVMPNEVASRGGAELVGFIDEAGWVEDLDAFLDNIEESTPFLIMASTPPKNAEHPFGKRALGGIEGYKITTTHWTMNPVFSNGIYWDKDADHRGPYTEHWRSPYYVQRLKTRELHEVARNLDLDYRSTAGTRIFTSWQPSKQVGPNSPPSPGFDLYDPAFRLELWLDVGRRDPWAAIWVCISDVTGEIRIVDYWMRAGVTAEWWIPIIQGWNPLRIAEWKTAPSLGMQPWARAVEGHYGEEDRALMRFWYERFANNPMGRPTTIVIDAYARGHHGNAPHSVEEIFRAYGFDVYCQSTAHNMDSWIEHTNTVLRRVKVSGRIADRKPLSGGVRYPSINDSLIYWCWGDPTPRESRTAQKPLHDVYSHGCTALIYGSMRQPSKWEGRYSPALGRSLPVKPVRGARRAVVAEDWTGQFQREGAPSPRRRKIILPGEHPSYPMV
jgi:hypothetical protein